MPIQLQEQACRAICRNSGTTRYLQLQCNLAACNPSKIYQKFSKLIGKASIVLQYFIKKAKKKVHAFIFCSLVTSF